MTQPTWYEACILLGGMTTLALNIILVYALAGILACGEQMKWW